MNSGGLVVVLTAVLTSVVDISRLKLHNDHTPR